MLWQRNHGSAVAEDPSLLARDGRDGWAKPLRVVKRNIGDDGDERIDDVGSIEAAAHAHFENRDVDFVLGEMEEGQRGEGRNGGRPAR